MPGIVQLAKAHPLYFGAAALGGYLLLRGGRRRGPAIEGVTGYGKIGPGVRTETHTTGPAGPEAIPMPSKSPFDGDPVHWVTLTTWRDEAQRARRIGDVLNAGVVRITVVASVPVVQGWVEIGGNKFNYCDGPGDVKPIVAKILHLTTLALDKGVASAAPKWSAVSNIVGNMLKKIPSMVERARQKKWIKWRRGLEDTTNLGSLDWSIASQSLEICQVWKFEGYWDHTALELPLVQTDENQGPIEIPWGSGARDVTGCLAGEAPTVTVSAHGQVRVTLIRPDVTPPGACEARYDVTASVAKE